ncbi:MAG: ABC-F family ATP-binding cassette domain-containing protein [Leifsonia sp.]
MPASLTHSDHIRIDGLTHAYGSHRVLDDVTLAVGRGQRVGLIGENGVGKSTLLRFVAGAETPDDGFITRPRRTGILWQEVQFAPTDTVDAVLEAALAEVRTIERELAAAAAALSDEAPEAAGRYADALDAAERVGIWDAEARRDAIRDGLGVGDIPLARRLDTVSGGQRSRVALAALLLSRPDALVLDEPTNHLDDAATAFLEAQLRAWHGPVIFASHDRAFLDAVATGIVELGAARVALAGAERAASVTVYGGRFSDYRAHQAAERARWEEQYAQEQDELRHLRLAVAETSRNINHDRPMRDRNKMAFGRRGDRVEQQVSRRVQNAALRLETLDRAQVRKPPAPLVFAGIPSGSQAMTEGLLVQATDIGLPGRLAPASLRVEPTSRILVTGRNGAGKSTLLGMLAGAVAPASGDFMRRRGLRVGLLEQDVLFADARATAREVYERTLGARRAEQVSLSSLGLIAPRDENRPVGELSIGQQRRLALALVIAKPPHLFLLDEPTNHLSLALATDLEDALGAYPGAVVIASHDRWLRRRWTGEELRLGEPAFVP